MRAEKCLCELIPKIKNHIPLTVLMHFKEAYKTTNTARLSHLCLTNSQIYIRGLPQQVINSEEFIKPGEEIFFLTLSESCQILSKELVEKTKNKIHLIVPDGTWSQAARVGRREPFLKKATWVQLPPGPLSRYRLRHEHTPQGLSTLEAIARAYGIMESEEIQQKLEEIFEIMVQRTLETRPLNRL